MSDVNHFSVQRRADTQDELAFGPCQDCEGRSPIEAAKQVLKEELTLVGRPEQIRCRVWHIDELFQPVSVLLYSPN